MLKRKYLGLIIAVCVLGQFALQPALSHAQTKEKVGVVFLHTGGGDWNYSVDWISQFFNNMWGIFADGFHTGGWVGKDVDQLKCYTQFHYANADEAAGCGVAQGTLIDVLCNEYPAGTAVHSVSEYGPNGDGSFSTDCYPDFGLPYMMFSSEAWQSTVDALFKHPGFGQMGMNDSPPQGRHHRHQHQQRISERQKRRLGIQLQAAELTARMRVVIGVAGQLDQDRVTQPIIAIP